MGALPVAGDRIGRYRVVGLLGHGGMGVVFTAVHEDLDREVALKLLAPQLVGDAEMVSRFRREARALARLDSAHVVHVYDTGEHDGWLYIATQLVPDGDLGALVAERGPLPAPEALALLEQVVQGLADAHAVGLVHRDVKPGNVLVRKQPGGLRAYLGDFGIAHGVDLATTTHQTQGVIGTWGYLAPERFSGHAATPGSDLYAAGCVLWFMLTGAMPYEGTMVDVAVAHQSAPVPQLSGTDAWSRVVNTLLRRTMAKLPEDRYDSADEMRAHLRALVDGARGEPPASPMLTAAAPTMAAPALASTGSTREATGSDPAWGPDTGRPARRRGRIVALTVAAVAAVAAVATVLGGVWESEREPDAAPPAQTGSEAGATDAGDRARGASPAEPRTRRSADQYCWNDSRRPVRSPSMCDTPEGRDGLAWVFPTLTDGCGDGKAANASIDRPELYECSVLLADGTEVQVNYSRWGGINGARAYYRRQLTDERTVVEGGRPTFHVLSGTVDGVYKVARLYADHPFGMTIYAPSPAHVQEAIETGLVSWRRPDQVLATSR